MLAQKAGVTVPTQVDPFKAAQKKAILRMMKSQLDHKTLYDSM
jgi:hypothetical protein